MKSKISQATKKSVSLLLAILMMFSMLTVAMTVTVNAATTYYYAYYANGTHNYVDMQYNQEKGLYFAYVHSGIVQIDNGNYYKFKITNNNLKQQGNQKPSMNLPDQCANYPIYDNTSNGTGIKNSDYLYRSSSISELDVSFDNVDYRNLQFPTSSYSIGESGTNKQLVITFKPGAGENTLLGQIGIWTKADYDASQGTTEPTTAPPTDPTLQTPKLKGDAFVLPNGEVTLTLDNQKDFGKKEVVDGVETGNYTPFDGLTFTYEVTASDGNTPTFSQSSSGELVDIKDKITITAGSTEDVTYTVTLTATATGYAQAVGTATVTVSNISFKQSDRIYAYAGGATLTSYGAWTAAEYAATQQAVYRDTPKTDGADTYPSLGATSATDLRIFLPSTAGSEVLLYNSFGAAVTINNVTIQPNTYQPVTLVDGQSYKFTANGLERTLKVYRSNAQGALYLNNTSTEYGGYTKIDATDGIPKMIQQLYKGKETGEIESGNSGAIADYTKNSVSDVAVKKVKGRGNTTWSLTDKKSFNVTFADNLKGDYLNSEFKGKKYSLLANYKDVTLSRNKILYALADEMGVTYSPNVATVDLYMNGLYMGSYLMCQKIEVGKNDVINTKGVVDTILDLDLPADQLAQKIDDGFSFLMELDSNYDANDDYGNEINGQKITVKEPEYTKEEVKENYNSNNSTSILNFIEGKYTQMMNALNGTSGNLSDIIDIDSFTRYMLLNELAKNCDIGVSSTYLVYNKTDGKFYASPVWDLDMSVANGDKSTDSNKINYVDYEGNWTNSNNELNKVMRAVFNNSEIKAKAKEIWTNDFYTNIVLESLNSLGQGAKNVDKSVLNNFVKWDTPYGHDGQYDDNIQARTELYKATYDVTTGEYTKSTTKTDYSDSPAGQTQFVIDWLTSRAAWMTDNYSEKYFFAVYNTKDNTTHRFALMQPTTSGTDTIYTYTTQKSDWEIRDGKNFKITTANNSTSFDNDKIVFDKSKVLHSSSIADVDITTDNNNDIIIKGNHGDIFVIEYNKTQGTLKIWTKDDYDLEHPVSTTTPPSVSIKGTNPEEIKVGAKVDITATVTPVKISGVAQAGDYTVTLLRNGTTYESKTVTFSDSTRSVPSSQTVTFTDVPLETENDVFTAKVSATIGGESYSADATKPVEYTNANARVNKIYFNPSGKAAWKPHISSNAVVTMTVKDERDVLINSFEMYIDSEENYALQKGVFTTKVDNATLESMKKSSTKITFTIGESSNQLTSDIINGAPTVKDGSIYTYSDEREDGKNAWSDYNIAPEEKYPFDAANYEDFVKKLSENQTQKILYFDNSVSGWHNVYFCNFDDRNGVKKDGNYFKNDTLPMKKIPNTDVWYIDFTGITDTDLAPSFGFLFKDRSGNAYGTDYQQTVDLVGTLNDDGITGDHFVRNAIGNGQEVYLNFEKTYKTNKNPIFITSSFYNCTAKDVSDNKGSKAESILKYRAFNTEWKNYALVLASKVKTKAVDIYFDLHNKATSDVNSMMIYHESIKNTDWKFPAEFTRLNRIGTSTIYRGSVELPYYSVDNQLKRHFNFTEYKICHYNDKGEIVSYETYKVGNAGQPSTEFINTGEIWFEINKNVNNVPTGASAKTPLVAAGANVSTVSTGASVTNWYIVPNYILGNWKLQGAIEAGYIIGSDTGTLTIDTTDNKANWNCIFAVVAKLDDGTYYNYRLSSGRELVAGEPYTLTSPYDISSNLDNCNSGNNSELQLNDSKLRYKTFTITKSGSDYQLTVSQSDTAPSVSTPSISLTATATELYIPQDATSVSTGLTPNVQNATDYTVKYTVTPADGASINGDTFTATTAGTYTVKASITVNGTTYTSDPVTITVKAPKVTINPVEALTLSGGEATATLSATPNADAGSATVTYSLVTSTTDATVSGTTFTAKKAGTYTVKASITVDGNTYTDTTTIIVNDPTPVVKNYYFYQYKDSEPHDHYYPMSNDNVKIEGTYIYVADAVNGNKFKITSSDVVADAPKDSPDYSVSKRPSFDASKIEFEGFNSASASLSSDEYNDIVINLGDYTVTENSKIVIEYTPGGDTGLDGKIKIYSYAAYYPTQSITLTATETSIDLANSSLTSTITAELTNLTGTATFSITSAPQGADTKGMLSSDGNTATFTATSTTPTGEYVITATVGDVTKTITITVTNSSSQPTTDYCNIIGYNTASANFSATNGGTVSDIKATITNGNYSEGSLNTGFTEVQPDGSVTLYYALINGTTGPVVKFTATTSHTDTSYSFDGWEKDGTLITDKDIVTNKTVADTIKTVNTVKYVANWSQQQYVKFTFTYNYKDQDYKTAGMEYNPGKTTNYSYEVTVMVSQDDAKDSVKIKELYLKYQPKISSDYYTYAFDQDITDSYDSVNLTGKAESTATPTAKSYKLIVMDDEGISLELKKDTYFYQNAVELNVTPAPGKTIVWENNGLVIGYGNSIKFRITETNTVITYREVEAADNSDRTVLHQPTYEFFTENDVEKVRFNFLVENEVEDLKKVELGVLYFLTDETGANSTVYPGGKDIPEGVLKTAVLSGATGINKKKITYANWRGDYIFNIKFTNNEANRQKYLRVYSYIKYTDKFDKDGNNLVILSDISTPVLGSISKATLL